MRGSVLYLVVILAAIFFDNSFAALCNEVEGKPGWYKCEGLTNLEQLDSLPDSVVGLKLVKSNISQLPADAFSRFAASLIELRIIGCSLERIEADAFRGLDKLEILDLSNNQIQTIEASWIRGLSNLKELIVLKNHIVKIESDVYDLLPKLEKLDIAYNGLVECLTKENIDKLKNLKLVLIASNPWSYRCRQQMSAHLKASKVDWIKDWSVGDILVEECLAHEEGADKDDNILKKCVDRKSFESISPIFSELEYKVLELSKKVEELRDDVNNLKKRS